MKAMLMSAAILVSAVAMANDETYRTEKKAEQKVENQLPSKATLAKPGQAAQAIENKLEKAEQTTQQLSQSELLDKLHKVSVGHTEMGNLAQTRAKGDKVKRFGEKMAKDFVRLDQQFIDYAKDHDIVLSDATGMFKGTVKGDLKSKKGEEFEKLGKLQGEAFDKAFLTATVSGCEKFIPVLEAAKGKYEDAGFDRVLDKAINTLKGYQKEAASISEKDYAPAS